LRIELINLDKYVISENPIILDDYSSGSYAVYYAINKNEKTFLCFMPDEERGFEPRCDYLMLGNEDNTIRFIELKGVDSTVEKKCCPSIWAHAFHQLIATYEAYEYLIDFENDIMKMILCTSANKIRLHDKKRSATRFEQYKYYKKIRENRIIPQILYCNEEDVV